MDKAPAYGAGDSGFESRYMGYFFCCRDTKIFIRQEKHLRKCNPGENELVMQGFMAKFSRLESALLDGEFEVQSQSAQLALTNVAVLHENQFFAHVNRSKHHLNIFRVFCRDI